MVSFTPQPLYPHGKSPGRHWIGDCVGPRIGLDTVSILTVIESELEKLDH